MVQATVNGYTFIPGSVESKQFGRVTPCNANGCFIVNPLSADILFKGYGTTIYCCKLVSRGKVEEFYCFSSHVPSLHAISITPSVYGYKSLDELLLVVQKQVQKALLKPASKDYQSHKDVLDLKWFLENLGFTFQNKKICRQSPLLFLALK